MELIDTFLNPTIIAASWPLLMQGLWLTVKLALIIVPLAALLGLIIACLHYQQHRWLNRLILLYVDFFRAFPPLVLLIFIYYGLPFLGLSLNEFSATVLALVLNSSGYFAEIFRAGLESVSPGQNEAARSTGLNARQAMAYVVVPQGVRNVIPDLASNTLEAIKQTSIASAVALPELLRSAQIMQGETYSQTPLVAAALIYFLLLWPLVRMISRMQKPFVIPR
ncbi:amino acid ABC transporter permease [Alcaligenes faecalis]|uniref:amino acid ABC transporter permease n=1 Tax=Alcaligenes faecalis TaxID=511 RepID=UPI0018EED454|nr:amino acid ABC transporter permease [Alcaligenes faecalis]